MWTEEHRRIYQREGDDYPSGLRDAEWARLEPLIPAGLSGENLREQKRRIAASPYVLAGLDPWAFSPWTGSVGIHVFDAYIEDVDTRDKPAHDDFTLSQDELRTRYA